MFETLFTNMFYEFHEAINEFTIRFDSHGVKMYGGGAGAQRVVLNTSRNFWTSPFMPPFHLL